MSTGIQPLTMIPARIEDLRGDVLFQSSDLDIGDVMRWTGAGWDHSAALSTVESDLGELSSDLAALTSAVATKAPLASPTFTGTVTADKLIVNGTTITLFVADKATNQIGFGTGTPTAPYDFLSHSGDIVAKFTGRFASSPSIFIATQLHSSYIFFGARTTGAFIQHSAGTSLTVEEQGGFAGKVVAGTLALSGSAGFNGSAPPAKAASPGVAVGTDAAVINSAVTILRNLGFCS